MPTNFITSQAAAARLLGVPRSTFRSWLSDPAFPKQSRHGWRADDLLSFAGSKTGEGLPSYNESRARRMAAAAAMAEFDLAQRRGELVSSAEVERVWSAKVAALRAELERQFSRIAPQLSGLDAVAIHKSLRSMWQNVQTTLSNEN